MIMKSERGSGLMMTPRSRVYIKKLQKKKKKVHDLKQKKKLQLYYIICSGHVTVVFIFGYLHNQVNQKSSLVVFQ